MLVVDGRALMIAVDVGGCGRVDFDMLLPPVDGSVDSFVENCAHPPNADDFNDNVATPSWIITPQDVGVTVDETGGELDRGKGN